MSISSHCKGASTEMLAAIRFMEMGWLVFKNVSVAGCVNLATLDPTTGEYQLWDIKYTKTKIKNYTRKPIQTQLNVKILCYSDGEWYEPILDLGPCQIIKERRMYLSDQVIELRNAGRTYSQIQAQCKISMHQITRILSEGKIHNDERMDV